MSMGSARIWRPLLHHTAGRRALLNLQINETKKDQHSFMSVVAVGCRVGDDATTNTGSNPRLRGIRHKNFGQKRRSWEEQYGTLLEYKRLHQHCRVPLRYSPDRALGSWVFEQRRKGREALSSEQLELLNKAGFDWETLEERNNRVWKEKYQQLVEYREINGDCDVPRRFVADPALGKWVSSQRACRKEGRLRVDREEQLDAIGFTWSVRNGPEKIKTDYVDRLWSKKYERLKEFREKWGHCLVPHPFEEEASLGTWVFTQRTMFRRGVLRPDRKKLLDEVEFVFDATNSTEPTLDDRHWNLMFQHLLEYKAEHGHANVKERHEEFGLGLWVKRQRINKTTLDEQRRKRLDGIGFLWTNPRKKRPSDVERAI